jgi:DNA-binding IclR family transcriptional regulator
MNLLSQLGDGELSVLTALQAAPESLDDAAIAGAARMSISEVRSALDTLCRLKLVTRAEDSNGHKRFVVNQARVGEAVREVGDAVASS